MKHLPVFAAMLLTASLAFGQAAAQAVGPIPTLEEVRRTMGIPSTEALRGQQDAVGFASRADQMAKVWELSALPPAPESFGLPVGPGVLGAICPHDDYLFAGRVYRRVLPLVTAKTVVLVGVFHKYRRFGMKDRIVLDPYSAWRSPDGPIPVSSLREELQVLLPEADFTQDAASHDSEHSLEAIAYWLRHQRADVEILPILVPSASFPRFQALASHLGSALAVLLKRHRWSLGQDVAIVMSSDGVHYGSDFKYTPFGEGGIEAYQKAVAQDRAILGGPLSGAISADKARSFFAACVNPDKPDEYRLTWCGRFSIPFGILLLEATVKGLGQPAPMGVPLAFGSSVDTPELPVKSLGMGATAPASLYHFVSYPGVAFVGGEK